MGYVFRPKYTGSDGAVRESQVYWLQYFRDGRRMRESSKTTSHQAATRLLREREGDIARGVAISNRTNRATVDELLADVVTDYRINGKKSVGHVERRISLHLAPFFGGKKAANVTTTMLRRYVEQRQSERAKNSSINRELAIFRRGFSLGLKAHPRKVTVAPSFPMLREDNVRTGFFERDQFEAVAAELPAELASAFRFAYVTGWRDHSEVLALQWRQVDFKGGVVRLDPGQTKNREGRVFPFTAELRELLEAERERTTVLERDQERIIPHVFHRAGQPIKDFYGAWRGACKRAGQPGRIPHDFRRTAVRNLVRAGVPERVAMQMTGHKTRSVFERYNIVSEGDLFEAADRLDKLAAKVTAKVGTISSKTAPGRGSK